MTRPVLALNAGSSSLKFGLFDGADGSEGLTLLATGSMHREREGFRFKAIAADGSVIADEPLPENSQRAVTERVLRWVEVRFGGDRLAAVGHRIVHGGGRFADPVLVDDEVLRELDDLIPLAPLHQPLGIAPIRLIGELRPGLPQVACFDTAFHRTIRPPASRYALPRDLEAQGIRRYGFHGLSYESIAHQLVAEGAGYDERIIVAHLGNGASLCALRDLKSVDTTMGFSALDGLVMGTRPGSIDPGILLYLLKERGMSAEQLEQLLYRQSGLLGVSGISSDVATLLASGAPPASEALDLFAFQVARHTAALAATLGGLDRFIFTGGIGEHSPEVCRMIAERLRWLGAELDNGANESGAVRISTSGSPVLLERRRTQEELAIARQCLERVQ